MVHGCGTHQLCDLAVALASGGHLGPGHMLSRTGWQLGCPGHSRALPVTSGSALTPGLHGDMVSVETGRLNRAVFVADILGSNLIAVIVYAAAYTTPPTHSHCIVMTDITS